MAPVEIKLQAQVLKQSPKTIFSRHVRIDIVDKF